MENTAAEKYFNKEDRQNDQSDIEEALEMKKPLDEELYQAERSISI